jgi:integrase
MPKKEKSELPEGIDLLPSGLYRWRSPVGYKNGKQVRVSGTTTSLKTAKMERAKALTDRARGKLAMPENTTVREYAKQWLSRKKNIAINTRNRYEEHLKAACNAGLGELKLQSVRTHHIKEVLSSLADKVMKSGLGKGRVMSSATLANIRMLLRTMFKEAYGEDGVITFNPADMVKRVKPLKTEHGGISLDFSEVAQLYELGEALYAGGNLRLWLALFTCVSIGLRRGEVMGLRWCDIDLEKGLLRVEKNLSAPKSVLTLGDTKTDGSRREILIPPSLKAALYRQRSAMEHEAKLRGETVRPEMPVFATVHGGHGYPEHLHRALRWLLDWSHAPTIQTKADGGLETPQEAERRFKRRFISIKREHQPQLERLIRNSTPLQRISPHDLRHTAGTLMLRRGVPIEVVSKTLGHKDITVTYRVYRHVLESEKRAHLVDLFENFNLGQTATAQPFN